MDWADYQFVVESHPTVLDGFVTMFRKEILEKNREEKTAAPAQQKPRERSDNFEL